MIVEHVLQLGKTFRNDICDYIIFVINSKYHRAIWTTNHIVMVSHICGLRSQCQLLM
jgi:hypothetical protein